MTPAIPSTRMDFGDFTVDFARQAVIRDGETLTLRPQSFHVLQHLLQQRGQVVSKQALFEAVWGDAVVTDDSLTQCLVEIRKALGGEGRKLLRTLPRRGYIFEGIPAQQASAATPQARTRTPPRLVLAGLVASLALLAGFLVHRATLGLAPPAEQGQVASDPIVVAVMPFADFTRSGDNNYLGYGIAEETLNRLTLVPGLRVIARTSSFALALDDKLTMEELGSRLGASHVVEGSVREHNGVLRITAQLIETASGHHLWSESFDQQSPDLLRVQDQIASAIAGVLQLGFAGPSADSVPITGEDHDRYLQASYLLNGRGLRSLQEARHLLEGVVASNPTYLPAVEKLFTVYQKQFLVGELDSGAAVALVEELALAVDGQPSAEPLVHRALGEAALHIEGNLVRAAEHLGMALQVAGENAATLRSGGELARQLGRFDEAIALHRAALALDPLCKLCHLNLAYSYMAQGALGRAEFAVREFMKFSRGGHFSLALVKTLQGEYAAAKAVLEQPIPAHMQLYKDYYQALLSFAEGDVTRYRKLRDSLVQAHSDSQAIRIAQLYAWGGNLEAAYEWSLRAAKADPTRFKHSLAEPVWGELPEDARFLNLLQQLGRAPEQLQAIDFEVPLSGNQG